MYNPVNDKTNSWVGTAFLLPQQSISSIDQRRNYFRSAAAKFTDTTLGGNFAINPPPQFTETADLVVASVFQKKNAIDGGNPSNYTVSNGMGRYYSEAIDDTAQHIHMGFGVPEFRSLSQMFTSTYNVDAASWARTGRGAGFFYTLGKAAGFVLTLPIQPIILAGKAVRFLMNKPSSKYYSLKPTMPLYWNAVNSMANGIAVNMGIVPRAWKDPNDAEGDRSIIAGKRAEGITANDLAAYKANYPDLYRPDGSIDIYGMSTRAQRLADRYNTAMLEKMATADTQTKLIDVIGKFFDDPLGDDALKSTKVSSAKQISGSTEKTTTGISMENYLEAWKKQQIATNPNPGKDVGAEVTGGEKSFFGSILDFAKAELRDGSRFVTFKVNGTGEVSESFSNSVRESDLASTLNGMSSDARTTRFNFADGNLGAGAIMGAVESVFGAAKDVASGVVDGLGVSGLMALSGTAFFDLPKHWDSSSANFPTSSYKIELRSPYGNKMSRFQNLYVPLCMLLAGALPLSTGKGTYTAPFLVELYDRGRNQIRLGIIDSLEVSRGVGNLGWNSQGEPLGIDVSFTVADLSSVMHMPISGNDSIFEEDSAYSDYLATLGSLSLTDQVYVMNKLSLNVTKRLTEFKSQSTPAAMASGIPMTMTGSLLSAMSRLSARSASSGG